MPQTAPSPVLDPPGGAPDGAAELGHSKLGVLSGCEAQRKFVTVLFADVKGSMELSGAVALEEWWSVIAGMFELMSESVHLYGGWVGNFTGDGIVGVFESLSANGENGPRPGHAHRGCAAALWLRDAVRAYADDVRREHGLELSVRLGLNSGEVLTGMIGNRYSRYYTASGYAVSLARRMEALARPGGIYLTEDTAALVGQEVRLLDLGAFEVKGAKKELKVYELLETRRQRGPTSPGPITVCRLKMG